MCNHLIPGGVCAPKGFLAGGVHCGIKKGSKKRDLALILSEAPAAAACVYTQNKVKGAPILVTQEHLAGGMARAILCNSGNANACAPGGLEAAKKMCELAAGQLSIEAGEIVVASTGVIGVPLPLEPIEKGIPALAASLSADGSGDACEAIMTTDTVKKEFAVSFTLGSMPCKMGIIAKGSGMIHPNMATMLGFVTTDVAIAPSVLQKALRAAADESFNMISVDGDTSTNDMLACLANGEAKNQHITTTDCVEYRAFLEALTFLCRLAAKSIAKDGEGATKLLEVTVSGAKDLDAAKTAAKAVACSSLLKAAMFGCDANWGRVLCALGYSGADLDPAKVAVAFSSRGGSLQVCKDGMAVPFSEELAKEVLSDDAIGVQISLGQGGASATAWGCDLTYDYVKINGDYRT